MRVKSKSRQLSGHHWIRRAAGAAAGILTAAMPAIKALLAILVLQALLAMPASAGILTAGEGTGIVHAQAAAEPFELLTEIGYGGDYISYRRTPVRVTVASRTEDFVGTVEILYADNTGNIMNYRKDLVLAAGETKEVCFYIKLPLQQSIMTARIADRNGKVQVEASQTITPTLNEGEMLVGILSEQDISSYLNSSAHSMVELRPDDITDARNMGMLDVILVDRFDLDSLEKTQVQDLEDWVRLGGTLVLGTGSYYNQTLAAFSEEFLSGKVGNLRDLVYSYREGAEDVFSYCPMTLDDAVPVMDIEGDTLIWKVERDKGSVLVSAVGLGLPSWLQLSLGEEIYNVIGRHISAESTMRIREETQGGSVYNIRNALNQGNEANMPNIPVYVVVLCVYVVLVGPLLYLILRRMDKRHYMWAAVPAASLVFAGIIFLLGMSTRISDPYMSYVTYLDYGTEQPAEKTFFSLMAPYNKTYDVMIEKDYQISQIRTYGYIDYQSGTVLEDYDVGIREYETGTDIELKDPAAFESYNFIAEGSAAAGGSYETELEMAEDGRITGNFTNQLGYDLEKVMLVDQGAIYLVGDVADGQTVQVDTAVMDCAIASSYYGLSNSGFLDRVFDHYYQNPEASRRYNALTYYLDSYSYRQNQEAYFIGVSNQTVAETLITGSEMENYGVTVSILPVEQTLRNGYVYSIDSFETAVLEGGHELPWNRYMDSDVVISDYEFPEEEGLPSAIWYSAMYNNELKGESYDYFPGTVSFLNQETGDYDLIFTGGIEGSFTELAPYLAEGHLIIRYEVEAEQFYNERYNIVIPVLSVTREVKTDGAD